MRVFCCMGSWTSTLSPQWRLLEAEDGRKPLLPELMNNLELRSRFFTSCVIAMGPEHFWKQREGFLLRLSRGSSVLPSHRFQSETAFQKSHLHLVSKQFVSSKCGLLKYWCINREVCFPAFSSLYTQGKIKSPLTTKIQTLIASGNHQGNQGRRPCWFKSVKLSVY